MDRRQWLAGLGAVTLMSAQEHAEHANTFLEIRFWRLHTTPEKQSERLAAYLEHGLSPALTRAGAKLAGAFSTVIGPDSPLVVTITQYPSLAAMGETLTRLKTDAAHTRELEKLGQGEGLPFVRVDSSLLRSFDAMPEPALGTGGEGRASRVFELRTYESQSFATLARKVEMFNGGEVQIFERLGFRPVFFGETLVGPKQPNLMYMLSYDDLGARDRFWKAFGSDPAWKELSGRAGLSDPEIVANISNVLLAPLAFSAIR